MTDTYRRSFADVPTLKVPGLDTAEQFVVGVFRCWDAFLAARDPQLAWRELYPVFAYMDVVRALCAVDAAFHVVRHYRLRTLTFREVDSLELGCAEARVLCGLASLQRGNTRDAGAALRGAIAERGIPTLLAPFARIAAVLDMKGHRLPPWRDSPTAIAPCPVAQNSVTQIGEGPRRARLRDVKALREADA